MGAFWGAKRILDGTACRPVVARATGRSATRTAIQAPTVFGWEAGDPMKDGAVVSDSIAGQRQFPSPRPDRSAVSDVLHENVAGRWNFATERIPMRAKLGCSPDRRKIVDECMMTQRVQFLGNETISEGDALDERLRR